MMCDRVRVKLSAKYGGVYVDASMRANKVIVVWGSALVRAGVPSQAVSEGKEYVFLPSEYELICTYVNEGEVERRNRLIEEVCDHVGGRDNVR